MASRSRHSAAASRKATVLGRVSPTPMGRPLEQLLLSHGYRSGGAYQLSTMGRPLEQLLLSQASGMEDIVRSMTQGRTVRPRRLVLVEDDAEMRRLVAEALREDGHSVTELEDGRAFLELLRLPEGTNPLRCADLVITAGRMPGCSGLDVIRAMRRLAPQVPDVLVTAFGSPETHEEAFALGAAAVIDKPFDLDELREVVVNVNG